MTDIEIPISVTSIGSRAFEGCSSLESIEIPTSVTSIGSRAFEDCSSLESIEIPTSVTSIGAYAFDGCSSLKNIEIPTSVTSIGEGAFLDCSNLTSITVADGNGYYTSEDGVLYNKVKTELIACLSIKTEVTILTSVTNIGAHAFDGCSNLKSIEIPTSVTSIGEGAFYGCDSLTSMEIPTNVASIGAHTFFGCERLRSIEIPTSVTSIGEGAFKFCSRLASIEIPISVISIGEWAFDGCEELRSIGIPASVEYIANNAFGGCDRLTIYGDSGSYAETYAKENGIPFELAEDFLEDVLVTAITLDKTSVSLNKDDSVTLSAMVLPANATNKKVIWNSSDTNIAMVDANGKVTAVAKGTVVITATATDGSGKYASCTVAITEPTIPTTPTDPTDPTNPTTPATPTNPAPPTNPTTPANPTTPGNPANPTTPSTPANAVKKLDTKNVTLKSATATYTGKAIKPAVTVKDGSKTLKSGTDYTVTYKNNKNVGTATITVSGKGSYTGIVTKTFKINPKKQTVKLTALKKGFKVSYTKATKAEATGYEIRYVTSKKALSKAKAVTVKSYKTATKSISKLKAGKKYFVQVRTYKKVGKETLYGAWSAAKSIKTKK